MYLAPHHVLIVPVTSSWVCPAQAGKAGQSTGDTLELWLYLEEAKTEKPLVPIAADNILLFFKLYDPKRQTLSYLGRCYAWETNRLPALMPFLRRKAGYTDSVSLQVSANCDASLVIDFAAVASRLVLSSPMHLGYSTGEHYW